jgi:DNA polymerase-3 subunit delta
MELLNQTLEDQSRFTVYSLVDSCLLGITDDCLHRLERIRTEADNAVLVVWSLARETRELLRMAYELNSGMNLSSVMQKNRVWSTRQRFVSAALNRLGSEELTDLLQRIVQLDAMAKGQRYGDIWHELEKLCLSYCAIETFPVVENNYSYAY